LLAALAVVVMAPAAGAYTQEYNIYPSTCGTFPNDCIAWPRLANGQSSTTHVFLTSSLGSITTVDMGQDVLDSFGRWNAAPSNEPWLVQSTAMSNSTGYSLGSPTYIYVDAGLADSVYAQTSTWTKYQLGIGSDDPVIVSFQIEISSTIRWNHSFDFTCHMTGDDCVYWADSRKVTIHEEGHGMGMGHSGATAIMKQGATTYYTLQTDDINGIQHIYGVP
jgi:hypothetical protein